MSVATNRLEITFNIPAIEEDFVFVRFNREHKKGKWYGAVELDELLGEDFKAIAVMFQYGKFAYAMFRKPIDVYQLLSHIRKNQKFSEIIVDEVPAKVSRNDAESCICEAWLAQILLNFLSSSKSRFPKYQYCNLTGKLLLVPDFSGKDSLDTAEISITNDYLIEVKTVRYRTRISILKELKGIKDERRKKQLNNALKRPDYIFEPSNSILRRLLPRDENIDNKLIYIESGLERKKASRVFLEFDDVDNFYKSRAGILFNIKSRIDQDLSKYMNVDFSRVEIDQVHEIENFLLDDKKQLISLLKNQSINIVDKINNQTSQRLVNFIKDFLAPYVLDKKMITCSNCDTCIGGSHQENALNFRIIHDSNYYLENQLEDEYLKSTNKTFNQHITIDSVSEDVEFKDVRPVIKTSFKELLIKRDITYRKLTLFDWEKLGLMGVWTFAARDEYTERVIFMEIQQDGQFDFHSIDQEDMLNNRKNEQKFDKYLKFIKPINTEDKEVDSEVFVISNTGDINQIYDTQQISLPNLADIKAILQEIGTPLPEDKQTGKDLSILVQEFSRAFNQNTDKLESLRAELAKLGNDKLDKDVFRRLLNEKLSKNSNIAQDLRNYLLNQHGIRLHLSKTKESKSELFDGYLDINYLRKSDQEAYYFVGSSAKSVKSSFKDACHFRKIVAVDNSQLIFEQILPTMDVDFVRTGQSTVIPFPFKYIREYQNFDTVPS